MKPRENIRPYHGFDSITCSHNVTMYRDDLVIKNIKTDFPAFSLDVENLMIGHAIPAVGPSRLLVLEISFLDSNGVEQLCTLCQLLNIHDELHHVDYLTWVL